MASIPASRVESVKQSPLNEKRWCLQLNCGHDAWITATKRPQRRMHVCPRCLEKLRATPTED